MSVEKLYGLSWVLLLFQLAGNPYESSAQELLQATSDSITLREVVVNADRQRLINRSTGLSVRFLDSAFLSKYQSGHLSETLSNLPGLDLIRIGSNKGKPMIRGLGFDRILVYEKGLKHEAQEWGLDHGLELSNYGVEEIMVLKGPATFRYGSNGIGGVIHLLPKPVPPKRSFGASATIMVSSNNQSLGTNLSFHKRWNSWYLRAQASRQHTADFRVPIDTVFVYNAPVSLSSGRVRNTASLQYDGWLENGFVGENFQVANTVSYWYSKSGFFANLHGMEPRNVDVERFDKSYSDILNPSDQVGHFKWNFRSTWRLNQHLFEVVAGFQRNVRYEFSSYIPHGFMPSKLPEIFSKQPQLERAYFKNVWSASVNNEIRWKNHRTQIGSQTEIQQNTIGGFGFLIPEFYQISSGLYLTNDWELNEQITIYPSIRYDVIQVSICEYKDWFNSPTWSESGGIEEQVVRALQLKRLFGQLSGGLGVGFFFNRSTLKLNIGKSFRAPTAKELGANGVNYHYFSFEKGNSALSPEISYQFDVDYAIQSSSWLLNVSSFYQFFPNYIYLNPTSEYDYAYGAGNQLFNYEQVEVSRFGGELQIQKTVGKQITLEGNANFVYAEQRSGFKAGYSLPFSPPSSFQLETTYTWPNRDAEEKLYISWVYLQAGAQNRIVPPEKKTPGYKIHHIRGGGVMRFGKKRLDA